MTDEPLNPDAIDEATDMSPREAAEAMREHEFTPPENLLKSEWAAASCAERRQHDVPYDATETLYRWHARQSAALLAERDALKEDLADALADVFFEIASEKDGWYCTNARGTAVAAAERLVELGRLEARPDNSSASRVGWYRPIKTESEQTQ